MTSGSSAEFGDRSILSCDGLTICSCTSSMVNLAEFRVCVLSWIFWRERTRSSLPDVGSSSPLFTSQAS